jgi:hypothetical protein
MKAASEALRGKPHVPCALCLQVCFEYQPEEGLEFYELISHLPGETVTMLPAALKVAVSPAAWSAAGIGSCCSGDLWS